MQDVTRYLRDQNISPGAHRLHISGYIRALVELGLLDRVRHGHGVRINGRGEEWLTNGTGHDANDAESTSRTT